MRSRLAVLSLAAFVALLPAAPASAQLYSVRATTVVIEEDWRIIVSQGNAAHDGPQMMTYMSPVSDTSAPYAWFMLNVRDAPNPYTPGGMMIQVWDHADNLITSATNSEDPEELNGVNETITWTQRMTLNFSAPRISYSIINGYHPVWLNFDPSCGLAAVSFSGPSTLAGYSPYVSVQHSKVGWMASNVTSMTLLTVRQKDANGTVIQTDNLNLAVDLTTN